MENAKEGWENYIYHKASPLFNMNVLEIEPIFQHLKPSYICSPQGIPPTLNCYIANICFFQQGGIFIHKVLFTHLWFDLLFCVYVQRLTLMEVTCSLPIDHEFIGIFIIIHDSYYVQIGSIIVGHETLEVCINNIFFRHHLVQFHHKTH
jgi:hypothetical protein